MTKTILITGSLGLVGSEAMKFFSEKGWNTVGIDTNMRHEFFGTPVKEAAKTLNVDFRDESAINLLFQKYTFDAVAHCGGQPSHDYSKEHVLEDFDINARGTVILLEAARKYSPNTVFVHCSTDKIYGEGMKRNDGHRTGISKFVDPRTGFEGWGTDDSVEYGLVEKETRYHSDHIFDENTPIKPALSPFGVAKLAADFYVQEYAAQGWLTTGVFRMGCITGRNHEGAEQHGFLAYLAKCIKEGKTYNIYGYKGKQVRDQIHAYDLVSAFGHFIENPKNGAVYNIGGGADRSTSVLEAGALISSKLGKDFKFEIKEKRFGDRQWDVHDVSKFRKDYPEWDYKYDLDAIIEDLCLK